ncbi:hypothetical protein ABZ649_02070 [Streptomyces albidoflavus]|uniref:hypothetical protein n=3 Tax=Streptomyces TaxID=1883 RepID=UPI0004BFDBF1|nr:hypothetical protein [Streptomyces albidoflavus]RZE17636.1 hypothetical protein C0Q93_19080 [Streptomyces albidoflavus]RZE37724.1 hypothetical protein C0Q94_19100 [Streptomyces albidoflavus]RZE40945.1 hypothetical protein C0Q95_18535 [Streptomyces albidoflavus]RZE61238.1 hypothetical protein C0R00_19505 [Streptomyces albidoflavus]RZE74670.1 hypothetical protein C0R01_19435 [Streptomyces albidoflavus]
MNDPVNRTMLLVDIEKFSDRDDVEQAFLRRMLYDVVDRTMERAGIDETLRLRADQGDSVMEFIDPNVPVPQVLRSVISELPAQLKAVNRMASRGAQMRLRTVVASGFIALDERGVWVGGDLNHACRLLDADLLRAALRERPGDVALCVSQSVWTGIVRHHHLGIPAEEFHEVTLASKNGPLPAWLLGPVPASGQAAPSPGASGPAPTPVPDASGERPGPAGGTEAGPSGGGSASTSTSALAAGPAPAAAPAPATPPPAGIHFTGGAPAFGGSLVMGNQHGVSGGRVDGDVVMGSVGGPPRPGRAADGHAPADATPEQDAPSPDDRQPPGTGEAGPR